MVNGSSRLRAGHTDHLEIEISVQAYSSAECLKDTIRKAIAEHSLQGWDLTGIFLQGSYIHLRFAIRSNGVQHSGAKADVRRPHK